MGSENIVEHYGNTDDIKTALIVVGFEEDKTAWIKSVEQNEVDGEPEWSDWTPWGSAADYTDNEAFAKLNGCPFKLDNITSPDAPA